MSDFKDELLTNTFAHAAVEAGVVALQRHSADADIGQALASEIAVTVVEAARASVVREAADQLRRQAERVSTPLPGDVVRRDAIKEAAQTLEGFADLLDEEYRQCHQSPIERLREMHELVYPRPDATRSPYFQQRGEWLW